MKNIIFYSLRILFLILLFYIKTDVAFTQQLSFSEKGIISSLSIDPKFSNDFLLLGGYKFKEISLFVSYEFYNKIDFSALYLGFSYYPLRKRISFETGSNVGLVNKKEIGLAIFFGEIFWINPKLGLNLQQKILSNKSLGYYYENRLGFIYILNL